MSPRDQIEHTEHTEQITPSAVTVRRAVAASAIGNATEWFDYGVYAYTAVYIGQAFFPSDDPTASTLGSCLLYTSPSPRDLSTSRMPSSA